MASVGVIFGELVRLRRGRGVLGEGVHARVGPGLRGLCGVAVDDDDAACRGKLIKRLNEVLARLPEDMQLTAAVGLGLYPETGQRFLEQRLAWLAEQRQYSARTMGRRLDEALRLLTEQLVKDSERPDSDGWYVHSLKVVLRLNLESPEALEERVIVATVDGLSELCTSISIPRHSDDHSSTHVLTTELVYGGALRLQDHPSESQFKRVISLPRTLSAGERHEYALRTKIPPGQLMAPHYMHVPLRRSDLFQLRVRFDTTRLPQSVWLLAEVPPAVIYDREPTAKVLTPDRFGEVYAVFSNPRQGFAYGVRWRE